MAYSKNRRTADLIAADGTVSGSKIPANAIDSTHYVDGSIDTVHIAADNIVTSLIADDVALGGNPTTTTQSASDNSTKIATTAYTDIAITALVDSSPSALNTLNELAAALGDDANFSTTVTNSIALKAPLASPTFTGTITGAGPWNLTHGSTPYLDLKVGSTMKGRFYADANQAIIEAVGNSLILKSASTTALTLDASQNATFAGTISGTGTITAASGKFSTERGSASAPTFTFSDDTDTGMFNVSNADLGFTVGGTERMRIDSSGKVLLQHTTSIANASLDDLEIGSGSGNAGMTIYSGTSNYGGLAFADGNSGSTEQYPGLIEYFHTNNALQFYTGATFRMSINSSGNVGIGTSDPQRLLHLQKTGGDSALLRIDTNNQSHVAGIELLSGHGDWGVYNSDTIGDALEFRDDTEGVTRMIILSNGNVGIGTTAPSEPLTIRSSSENVNTVLLNIGNDVHATNTKDAWIRFEASTGGSTDQSWAIGTSNDSFRIVDLGTRATAPHNGTERMRINNEGKLIVGGLYDSDPYPASANQFFTVTANDYVCSFRHDGNATTSSGIGVICGPNDASGTTTVLGIQDGDGSGKGGITFSGSTTSYNTSSDLRLKNITGEAKGLEVINKLNPVEYTWKKGGQKGIGLIAQEAIEHVPTAVQENPQTEYYEMDYSKLVTPLIKAVQEQQTIIEDLKARITTLEG